jgi:hypothetical protein
MSIISHVSDYFESLLETNDLHDYIHDVLNTGDHGSHRLILFDLPTLNNAIEKHADTIGISNGCN